MNSDVRFAILGGAQGSGKGSASAILQNRYKGRVFAIETGAMLREIAKKDPEAEVSQLMRAGLLVPDELIFSLVLKRKEEILANEVDHNEEGPIWIFLDGVPRNDVQAVELCNYLGEQLKYVFILNVDQDILNNRTLKRRVCSKCGAIFNLEGSYAPKQPGICDKCGSNLIQRKDDTPESLEKRWGTYYNMTLPALKSMEEFGVKVLQMNNNDGLAAEAIGCRLF